MLLSAFSAYFLLASVLSLVLASPVPDFEGDDTVPTRTTGLRARKDQPTSVPLHLWIKPLAGPEHPLEQHWLLVINKKHTYEVQKYSGEDEFDEPLHPVHDSNFNPALSGNKLIDLKTMATFPSLQEYYNAVAGLKNEVKLTKLPTETGGNCMDYIKMVLEWWKKQKYIEEVPKEFTNLFDRDYVKVKAATWDTWKKEHDEKKAAEAKKKQGGNSRRMQLEAGVHY